VNGSKVGAQFRLSPVENDEQLVLMVGWMIGWMVTLAGTTITLVVVLVTTGSCCNTAALYGRLMDGENVRRKKISEERNS
jgi:hypothetical protein